MQTARKLNERKKIEIIESFFFLKRVKTVAVEFIFHNAKENKIYTRRLILLFRFREYFPGK